MPNIICYPTDLPDSVWEYCPSFAAAILFSVLFGLTSSLHVVQAFFYRKPFALVVVMGALWETGGYIARIISVQNQRSNGVYTIQLLLILLAPLWINAYVYMLLGRMIHFFLADDRVFKVRARRITRVFVLFDITAFLIQVIGGVMTTPDSSASVQKTGLNIYTAGVGVQLFFLVIFISLAIGFQRNLKQQTRSLQPAFPDAEPPTRHSYSSTFLMVNTSATTAPIDTRLPNPRLATPLLRLLYVVMALIILRNIYRLVEFGTGLDSPTVKHEWYGYVFDAVPMFFALVILNIYYPGKVLRGPRSDFSLEDKERKLAKKEKKQAKKADRRDRKEAWKTGRGLTGERYGALSEISQCRM